MSKSHERRREPRFPTNIGIRFRVNADGDTCEWISGRLMTAGGNGLFIKTARDLETGAAVEVELPFKGEAVCSAGVVLWECPGEPHGYGIRLTEIDDEIRAQILDEITSGRWLSEGASKKDKSDSRIFFADLSAILKEQKKKPEAE
ncbi:MAG: PilZ domain-containing protein [Planctomycetes bacterium]|nr:PilZ domain-containing protein [Planctomycetota bacterium]